MHGIRAEPATGLKRRRSALAATTSERSMR